MEKKWWNRGGGGGDLKDASHLISGCERWTRDDGEWSWNLSGMELCETCNGGESTRFQESKKRAEFCDLKIPCLSCRLVSCFIFSFKWNKTQSEICPLDPGRANILHSGAQCDCFVKVSFFCNKVISTIRENHFCDILKRPIRAT